MTNTIEQIKDKVLLLPNGDLIYEMVVSAYDLGYLEAQEKYKIVLENYQKLVELMKMKDLK